MTIGVAILTLNAARDIGPLLGVLKGEHPQRLVVFDSESSDGTPDIVRQAGGVELVTVRRAEFNHGATREFARRFLATDIVVFLTQDVIPESGFLAALVAPLESGRAVVAYSRQLPHRGADVFEAFPREFNYPAESNLRSFADVPRYGVYAFFCSDSASAYLNRALDAIGGFQTILTNEDYFAVAKLLQAGGRIAYAAESRVRHSHRYTLEEEFRRYFDTGYVRAENAWASDLVGPAEGRGSAFFGTLLRRLWREAPWRIPYAVLQTGVKWLGYRIGFLSYRLPLWWCRQWTSQRYYWGSAHCRHPSAR